MSERDELPEGWLEQWSDYPDQPLEYGWQAFCDDGRATAWFSTRAEAIAAAWRIVDAEKEAADGR